MTSFVQTAEADIEKVASRIKGLILKAVGVGDQVLRTAEADAPEVEALVALVAPQASVFVSAGLSLLHSAVQAADATGAAAAGNGLVVNLDAAGLAAIKQLGPSWKRFVAALGGSPAAAAAAVTGQPAPTAPKP